MPEHITKKEDFSEAVPEYLLRLDLACGKNKKEGFKSVDKDADANPDFLHDLLLYDSRWPFEDQSVYEIYCNQFIQKNTNKNLPYFMDEIYRILVPKGRILIIAPYYTHIQAYRKKNMSFITEETFNEFKDRFDIKSTRYYFEPEWELRDIHAQDWARKHYFNVVLAIEVVLEKSIRKEIKGGNNDKKKRIIEKDTIFRKRNKRN